MQNVPLVVNGELLRGERAAAARAEMQARYSEDGMRRRRAEDGVAEPEEEQEEDSRGQVADWAMSRLSNKMFLAKVGVWALLLWLSGEFWLIYMIASCMILMLSNFTARKPGEVSAYSVFNKDFKELPGTLSASRLQAALIPGAANLDLSVSGSRGGPPAPAPVDEDYGDTEDEEEDLRRAIAASLKDPSARHVVGKLAVNGPCPCGSGAKYKHCCK